MSRWGRGLEAAAAVALLAAVAVGAPEFGYESRYSYDDVVVGEVGRLREYDATVTGVRLVRSIPRYDAVLSTEHTFVAVSLTAAARTEVQNLTNIELVTSEGRRYDARPEWFAAALRITQPGFTSEGTLVFEVPREALRGAVLVVGPDLGETTGFDRAVRVRLGLDDDQPVEPGPVDLPAATTRVTA
jgi:hypothetical protein